MKYCKTDINTSNLIISDYNWRLFSNFKVYGKKEVSYNLIESLLKDTYTYHDRLKHFIKAASYSQILFHKKYSISESIIELYVNSLYAYAMINIDIVKGKPKKIDENIISDIQNINNITFVAEVKIEYLKEKYWSNRFKVDNICH
jgi:hypothetical protein